MCTDTEWGVFAQFVEEKYRHAGSILLSHTEAQADTFLCYKTDTMMQATSTNISAKWQLFENIG